MRHLLSALLIVPTIALVAPPPTARACGGFFCNAVSQTPIIQAGERVLFARHDGRVTMHIEVVYAGEPTDFGWLLPVPEAPTDATGKPLQLDKAVSLSSQTLFSRLQAGTDPSFRVQNTFEVGGACVSPNTATSSADTSSGPQDAATSGDTFTPPPVVVLEEAEVGPYNAQLIHADDSDALYAWLNLNGYLQDPAARPLLDQYVTKGFEFIGIRLKSGKSTGDLRPLAISLGENAPCVPLRLTAIAAAPDMPILVWVLGDGRAVPKNFIHAEINELAFQFPGASNYQDVISRAIDTASGRAWVTEYAGPTDPWRDTFALAPALRSAVASATTASELIAVLSSPGEVDIDAVLRDAIAKPAGLRGYPYGSCYYCAGCNNDSCPDEDAAHVTTDAEFYNFLDYWVGRADEIGLVIDVPGLAARLEREAFEPNMAIDELFASTTTMTRFYTLLDPSEMTRDPIFAFNPDLPMVSNDHVIDTVVRADADCNQYVDVTYPDGRTWRVLCGFGCPFAIGPVPGEEPLLHAEVLDESGPPIIIGESQVTEVDRLLDGASPGLPTLPPSFVPRPPKGPRSPAKPSVEASGGCASGGGPALPIGLAFVVLVVGLERRRRDAHLRRR